MLPARKSIIRPKSEIPDVSLVTKDSISLTSSSSRDSEDTEIICSDAATVKTGAVQLDSESKEFLKLDFNGRFDVLWNKRNQATDSFKTKLAYVHKVARVSPKRSSNHIIWNAYASTKSFKAIITRVIKIQTVARRWLVLKEKREVELAKERMAVKVQSIWRRVMRTVIYSKIVQGMRIRCF